MCKAIIKSGFCPRRRLACSFVHSIKKIFSILSKNPKYKIVLCLPTESKNSSSIITSCNEKDLETHKKKLSASYLFRILTIITKNQRIVWHEFPLPLTISFFIWKYEKVWKHPGRKIIKVSLIDIVKNIRGYQLNTHWLFFQNMTLTSNMATKKKTYFQPSQLQSQTISIHMKIWIRFRNVQEATSANYNCAKLGAKRPALHILPNAYKHIDFTLSAYPPSTATSSSRMSFTRSNQLTVLGINQETLEEKELFKIKEKKSLKLDNLAKKIMSGVLAMMQKPTLKQMTLIKNYFLVLLPEQDSAAHFSQCQ